MSAPTKLTREALSDAIRHVAKAWDAWSASEQPRTQWHGREVKCLSESLIKAFHQLIELVSTMNVEPRIKKIVLAIDHFDDQLKRWAEDMSAFPDQTDPAGSPELREAWVQVVNKFKEKVRSKPSPISEYDQQNLSDRQIARMYFWRDDNGDDDIARVLRERKKPGSEFNPETWVHPLDVKDDQKIGQAWEMRSSRVDNKQAELGVAPEAPESIYELLQQNVSSEQILRMKKGSTIEGIRNVARAHNLAVDGVKPDGENTEELAEPEIPASPTSEEILGGNGVPAPFQAVPAVIYDGDDQKRGFLVNAISEMQTNGKTVEEIVELMQEDFPQLTPDHVMAIQSDLAQETVAGL